MALIKLQDHPSIWIDTNHIVMAIYGDDDWEIDIELSNKATFHYTGSTASAIKDQLSRVAHNDRIEQHKVN